jgi:hypothetical protein
MKALSLTGLLFGAAIVATVPISPQFTSRGLEIRLDQAQAQVTRGQARRVTRRAYRQSYRYAARGGFGIYGAGAYGPSYGYWGSGYAYPRYGSVGSSYAYAGQGYGYSVATGPRRSCTVYPSGFRWCWTYF